MSEKLKKDCEDAGIGVVYLHNDKFAIRVTGLTIESAEGQEVIEFADRIARLSELEADKLKRSEFIQSLKNTIEWERINKKSTIDKLKIAVEALEGIIDKSYQTVGKCAERVTWVEIAQQALDKIKGGNDG